MTYRGRVKNGVIVLDPPASLPEGAEVEVLPKTDESSEPTWAEVFKDITGKAEGLPSDMARNHDHYLHGASKRSRPASRIRCTSSRSSIPVTKRIRAP